MPGIRIRVKNTVSLPKSSLSSKQRSQVDALPKSHDETVLEFRVGTKQLWPADGDRTTAGREEGTENVRLAQRRRRRRRRRRRLRPLMVSEISSRPGISAAGGRAAGQRTFPAPPPRYYRAGLGRPAGAAARDRTRKAGSPGEGSLAGCHQQIKGCSSAPVGGIDSS